MLPLIFLDPDPVQKIKSIASDPVSNIKSIVAEPVSKAQLISKDICNYVPYILFITTLILLCIIKNIKLLLFYTSGFLLNIIINRLSRNMIKDTRLIENGHEKYNMPSGHSQITLYSTAFLITILLLNPILFSNNNTIFNIKIAYLINCLIILFYLILSFMTTHKCIDGKYHTVDQVIVGVIIGCIIGIGSGYYSIKMNLC
jgi:membrane-associated phospholipid phosphatase